MAGSAVLLCASLIGSMVPTKAAQVQGITVGPLKVPCTQGVAPAVPSVNPDCVRSAETLAFDGLGFKSSPLPTACR